MQTSENGIDLIKGFEGFSAVPRPDINGINEIGFGHDIKPGETFTSVDENDATDLLCKDLAYFESIINDNVIAPLNQNQFDALVSFVYNVGPGRGGVKDGFLHLRSGAESTMLRKLNAGDYEGAAAQFLNWDNADGVESEGLYNRRTKEMELFLTAV